MSADRRLEVYATDGQVWAVALDGAGKFEQACLYQPELPAQYGDMYAVKVLRTLDALGGCFVALESPLEGFLASRKNFNPKEGDFFAASVTREAQHGKGARLRVEPDFPLSEGIRAQKTPCRLKKGLSPLEALAQDFPEAGIYSPTPEAALFFSKAVRPRFQIDYQAFDESVKAEFLALGENYLDLGEGISAHFEMMEALTAFDLDAPNGADFKANLRAVERLLHEIKLRGIGGVILIDPAGLPVKKRFALTKFIQDYAAKTPSLEDIKVLGATPSGMIELSVRRTRRSLYESLRKFIEKQQVV